MWMVHILGHVTRNLKSREEKTQKKTITKSVGSSHIHIFS